VLGTRPVTSGLRHLGPHLFVENVQVGAPWTLTSGSVSSDGFLPQAVERVRTFRRPTDTVRYARIL